MGVKPMSRLLTNSVRWGCSTHDNEFKAKADLVAHDKKFKGSCLVWWDWEVGK